MSQSKHYFDLLFALAKDNDITSSIEKEEDFGVKLQDSFSKEKIKREQAITKEIETRNDRRYGYADQFMYISWISLIFVGVLVVIDGYEHNAFELSDTVLIVLLGTALSTVFSPTLLLAKYLFKYDKGSNW